MRELKLFIVVCVTETLSKTLVLDAWPVFATERPKLEDWTEGLDPEDPFTRIKIIGGEDGCKEFKPIRQALRSVAESYDDTGCEGCGVIDDHVVREVREVLHGEYKR